MMMYVSFSLTNIILTCASWQHTQTFKAIQNIQKSLPPQILMQKPVMFLDALDRLAPIHLEWINSREAFLAVLKVRFKHNGLQMIEEGRFVVQATKSKRDIDLNTPWEICLLPGQEYDMSMLFDDPRPSSETVCTFCGQLCPGNTGEDITWWVPKRFSIDVHRLTSISSGNCHATFRRVVELPEDNPDADRERKAHDTSEFDLAGAGKSQQERMPAVETKRREPIESFRRVRLRCRTQFQKNHRAAHSPPPSSSVEVVESRAHEESDDVSAHRAKHQSNTITRPKPKTDRKATHWICCHCHAIFLIMLYTSCLICYHQRCKRCSLRRKLGGE